MTINEEQAIALQETLEAKLAKAVERAIRAFLAEVTEVTVKAIKDGLVPGVHNDPTPDGLVAALSLPKSPAPLPSGLPTLGQMAGMWINQVDTILLDSIRETFQDGYMAYLETGEIMESAYLEGMEHFIGKARDRLVVGTHFGVPIYHGSYDFVREQLAHATVNGWSNDKLAERIAERLHWATNRDYWLSEKRMIDNSIDKMLDKIGPIGSPAREHARLYDPWVQALRNERNRIIETLDADKSVWQVRAELIARTESTGAMNTGALNALLSEGATHKQWVATLDPRTRDSHAQADGQIVLIDKTFRVGDAYLQFPGDPSAPVEEVANCRCTIIDPESTGWKDPDARNKLAEKLREQAEEEERLAKEAKAAAARQARLEKKWKGKPPPTEPTRPTKPKGAQSLARDQWMRDMNARYDALGTGKTLDKSFNYHLVTQARDGSRSALDDLLRMHYVDNRLYQQALDMWRMTDALSPEAKLAHRKAMKNYHSAMWHYRKRLEEWREINGIVGGLRGMVDDALVFSSNRDAGSWMVKNLPEIGYGPGLDSLRQYTGIAYRDINSGLRTYAGRELPRQGWVTHVKNIDEVMATSKLPRDVVFYRGTNFDEFVGANGTRLGYTVPPPDPRSLIGTVQSQPGYWSVSYGSTDATGAMSGSVQMIIRTPKDTPAIEATRFSVYGNNEREVILGRGQQFFVHDVYEHRSRGHWIIEVEVLPDGVTAQQVAGTVPMPRPK